MTNMTTTTTKTRLAQGSVAIETAVTINWETASIDDVRALATRTIIIAAQAQWRTAGAIPTEATWTRTPSPIRSARASRRTPLRRQSRPWRKCRPKNARPSWLRWPNQTNRLGLGLGGFFFIIVSGETNYAIDH